jgi:hypothetical protein
MKNTASTLAVRKVQLEEAIVCTFSEAKTGKVIVEYVVKGRW